VELKNKYNRLPNCKEEKNIKYNGKKNKKKRLRDSYGNVNHVTWRGRRLQDKW